MKRYLPHLMLVIAAAVFLLSVVPAHAAGFYVREQSSSAMTTGFAGAASRGPDASYLFYNPATIIFNDSISATADIRLFVPKVEVSGLSATTPAFPPPGPPVGGVPSTGNMADGGVAPSFYASYAITDRLRIGIGASTPFAAVIEAKPDWIGRFHLLETDMRSYNLNPVFAYRINNVLTVGAGLQVQYFEADLRNAQLFPPPFGFLPTTGFLRGDDWGIGFTAGVVIQPGADTTIGVGYRSRIKHELKGTAGVTLPGIPEQNARFTITTPDVLTVSVSHQANARLSVHATFEWANWSLFKDITVRFEAPLPNEVRPQNWSDTYSGFLGATYELSDATSVGIGGGYTTAVSNGKGSAILPDGDRITLAVGMTRKLNERWKFDLSYAHIFFKDADLEVSSPTAGTLTAVSHINLDILSLGLTASW